MIARTIICLMALLCVSYLPTSVNANEVSRLVFLTFNDNTEYKQIKSNEIFSEYLLEKICVGKFFTVTEHFMDETVLDVEKNLNSDSYSIKKAKENEDFEFLMTVHDDSIHKKGAGQFLSQELTRTIGEKYNVDYILHGSVEYLGADIEIDTSLVSIAGIEKTKPYLVAVVIVRLIDALSGQVVWTCQAYGKAKDHLYSGRNLKLGNGKLNSQLFYEAIDDVSRKVIDMLEDDIKNGKLVLKKEDAC